MAQTNGELQSTRHEHRLMANEQAEFEANIIGWYDLQLHIKKSKKVIIFLEKCSKEKQSVELELKILKETHVEKLQSLSTTLNHLAGTIASLRNQLKQNNIKEGR